MFSQYDGKNMGSHLGKSSNQAQSMTNKKNPKNGKGCRNDMPKICKQGRDISAGKFTKPHSCIFMIGIGTVGMGMLLISVPIHNFSLKI